MYRFNLRDGLASELRKLAFSEGTTLYVVLLAAFQSLLHWYTGQQGIVVGSPVSGRGRQEFESVIGCFFNAVVIRTNSGGNPTFRKLLSRVRSKVLRALEHQDYPSHLLAERLQSVCDPA